MPTRVICYWPLNIRLHMVLLMKYDRCHRFLLCNQSPSEQIDADWLILIYNYTLMIKSILITVYIICVYDYYVWTQFGATRAFCSVLIRWLLDFIWDNSLEFSAQIQALVLSDIWIWLWVFQWFLMKHWVCALVTSCCLLILSCKQLEYDFSFFVSPQKCSFAHCWPSAKLSLGCRLGRRQQ